MDPLDFSRMIELRKELSSPPQSSLSEVFHFRKDSSKVAILKRLIQARFGPGKLSTGEFVKYDRAGMPADELLRFVGVEVQSSLHATCNDREWFAVTKNKLLFEMLLKGAGFPVPRTIAAFDRKQRGAGVPVISEPDDLVRFLKDGLSYPCFCKPTTGVYSLGTLHLDLSSTSDIIVNHQYPKTAEEIAAFIMESSPKGYVFQEVLNPVDKLAGEIEVPGLVSLRFLVLLGKKGPQIERCVAKVPGKGEVADNFWRPGAQLWAIDKSSGEVLRRVQQTGKGYDLIDQGQEKTQSVVGYGNARELVLNASRLLSGIRTQSWDVALTNKGPVLLEVNFGGDLSLAQTAFGEGILSENYCRHLVECGYVEKLPTSAGPRN